MEHESTLTERQVRYWRTACAAIILLSGALFAGALTGLPIWDDIPLINGQGIGGGRSFLACFTEPFLGTYFRPLVSVSFYLERFLWGSGPFGYHQTNILIHMLNTGLMIVLLRAACGDRRVALLGALLFAIHPVHVSSVAWIGGRTDPMVCLFMTLFAIGIIRSAQESGRRSNLYLGGAAFAFVLALLCKEQVLTTLPLAPLAYRFFSRTEVPAEQRRSAWRAGGLFCACALLFVCCWFLAAPPKQGLLANGLGNLLMRAGHTLASYTALLAAPTGTSMHAFTLNPAAQYGWSSALFGYAALGGLVWFTVSGWKRRSPAAWWALWILLTVVPISNFLPIATLLVAPYRVEVTQIAVAALSAWGLVALWDGAVRMPRLRFAMTAATAVMAAWFCALCAWGSPRWQSTEVFFRTVARFDPDCVFARETLVGTLMQQKRLDEASRELEGLMDRLMPHGGWRDAMEARRFLSDGSPLFARLRQNQGGSIDPDVWMANLYAELGQLKLQQHRGEEALPLLKLAVLLDSSSYEAVLGLGFCYLDRGDYSRALTWASKAVDRGPLMADPRALRGRIYAKMGRWEKARADFAWCVHEQPWAGQAYLELASAQQRLGDREGAARTLQTALRVSPQRDDIRKMLAGI